MRAKAISLGSVVQDRLGNGSPAIYFNNVIFSTKDCTTHHFSSSGKSGKFLNDL